MEGYKAIRALLVATAFGADIGAPVSTAPTE